MTDRFKFRAWDTAQNTMKECTQITLDKDKVIVHLVYQPQYIVMQSINRKDKNGKLIFIGDIVKDTGSNSTYRVRENKNAICLDLQGKKP